MFLLPCFALLLPAVSVTKKITKEMKEMNGEWTSRNYVEPVSKREREREEKQERGKGISRGRQVAESVTCCKFDLDLCVFLCLLFFFLTRAGRLICFVFVLLF